MFSIGENLSYLTMLPRVTMKASKLTKETINAIGVYERDFPEFNVGDTIAVSQRIKEGARERLQVFQGDVLAKKGTGANRTFTVRKIASDKIPVERIFPYFAPFVEEIKVIKRGKVRRAKLYYIRDRIGKSARIKEIVQTKAQKEAARAKKAAKLKAAPKAAAPVKKEVSETSK